MTDFQNMKNKFLKEREERRKMIDSIPWRERVTSFNQIKRCYVDRGIPVEKFLTDHPEKVERYNITIDDLLYITAKIKKIK